MMEARHIVYVVTKWKNGCVYRTKQVGEVWLPVKPRTAAEDAAIAAACSGERLQVTVDYRINGEKI